MSKRLTPKEIKQQIRDDEIRSFMSRGMEYLQENPSHVIGGAAGILVLVLLFAGITGLMNQRQDNAGEDLASAMKIYGAEVVEENAKPEDPKAPSFPSEEARKERAREAFDDVSGGVVGDVAQLYLAEMAIEEGDTAKAREIWEGFLRSNKEHLLAVSVRLNLIHLDRDEGKAAEVAEQLQQQLDGTKKTLPEDVLLYELAVTHEALDQKEEAIELYQRILDDYPDSPYTAEARRVTTSVS